MPGIVVQQMPESMYPKLQEEAQQQAELKAKEEAKFLEDYNAQLLKKAPPAHISNETYNNMLKTLNFDLDSESSIPEKKIYIK